MGARLRVGKVRNMLDFLHRMASKASSVRYLVVTACGFFLLSTVAIALTSGSAQDDRYLIPSIVGLLWSLSTWTFISTFRSIPQKPAQTLGLIGRFGTRIRRGWYWFLALACGLSSAAVVWISVRLISLWLREYAR